MFGSTESTVQTANSQAGRALFEEGSVVVLPHIEEPGQGETPTGDWSNCEDGASAEKEAKPQKSRRLTRTRRKATGKENKGRGRDRKVKIVTASSIEERKRRRMPMQPADGLFR